MSGLLLILRHGETALNRERRFSSHTDTDLNRAGRLQAEAAALEVGHLNIASVFSSPARRARQTAAPLLTRPAPRHPELVVDDRLRELDFGPFEGLTAPEILQSEAAGAFRSWQGAENPEFLDGAETFADAAARAEAVFTAIQGGEPGARVIITHSHIGRILLARCVLDVAVDRYRRLRLDNGRFVVVRLEDTLPRILAFNTTHLDEVIRREREERCHY